MISVIVTALYYDTHLVNQGSMEYFVKQEPTASVAECVGRRECDPKIPGSNPPAYQLYIIFHVLHFIPNMMTYNFNFYIT